MVVVAVMVVVNMLGFKVNVGVGFHVFLKFLVLEFSLFASFARTTTSTMFGVMHHVVEEKVGTMTSEFGNVMVSSAF